MKLFLRGFFSYFPYVLFLFSFSFTIQKLHQFQILNSLDTCFFYFPDSLDYKNVSLWYMGQIEGSPYALKIRPFVYPLFLLIFKNNYHLIVWIQAFFISMVPVLLFLCLKKWTGFLGGLFGVCLLLIHPSFFLLPGYGLTEALASFLLMLWVLSRFYIQSTFINLFLSSILTCTKPVFQVLIFWDLIFIFIFRKDIPWKKLRTYFNLILALAPVLYQLGFMVFHFGIWKLSLISEDTLKYYLYTKYLMLKFNLEYELARSLIDKFSYIIIPYISSDPLGLLKAYLSNLADNFDSYSILAMCPENIKLGFKTQKFNMYFSRFLLYFQVFIIIFLLARWKDRKESLWDILSIFIPAYFISLTSGLSFWQGDRLVITVYPLWVFIFVFIFSKFMRTIVSPWSVIKSLFKNHEITSKSK